MALVFETQGSWPLKGEHMGTLASIHKLDPNMAITLPYFRFRPELEALRTQGHAGFQTVLRQPDLRVPGEQVLALLRPD